MSHCCGNVYMRSFILGFMGSIARWPLESSVSIPMGSVKDSTRMFSCFPNSSDTKVISAAEKKHPSLFMLP